MLEAVAAQVCALWDFFIMPDRCTDAKRLWWHRFVMCVGNDVCKEVMCREGCLCLRQDNGAGCRMKT